MQAVSLFSGPLNMTVLHLTLTPIRVVLNFLPKCDLEIKEERTWETEAG
jgi:hypothetical protein